MNKDGNPCMQESWPPRVYEGDFIHCKGNPPVPSTDWNFGECNFGWYASNLSSKTVSNDSQWIMDPDNDPQVISPWISVNADQYDGIEITMANNAQSTTGRIYFVNSGGEGFSETKSVSFSTTNDGNWRPYKVRMDGKTDWQGIITRLRIDPVENGNSGYDAIGIDRVRFVKMDTTPPTKPSNLHPTDPPDKWYNNYTKLQRPTFAWNASSDSGSGLKGYYAAIDQSNPDGKGTNDKWVGNTTSWQVVTNLSDGSRFLRVKAQDKILPEK